MKKALAVAKWEFIEKVRTKTFIVSLIVTPIIIIAFSMGPALLSDQEAEQTKAIGIVDMSDIYINDFRQKLDEYKIKDDQPNYLIRNLYQKNNSPEISKKEADKLVINDKVEGYIFIENAGTDSVALEYRTKKVGNFKDLRRFEEAFNEIRIEKKLSSAGVDKSLMEIILKNVELNSVKIEKTGEESDSDFFMVFFSSIIFILLLMMMIIYSGQMLVRSLLEEKSNRLIEILVSSCKPEELLTGKILGLSSLGLSQIVIWSLIGIALAGAAVIPYSAFDNILPMLLYFVLGFIFYTAIFVGVGSIVTTEQEAQQITSYLSLILVLPIIFALPAIENPNSTIIQVLSYIPFTLPSVMLLRYNVTEIPLWEFVSTVFIMVASIYFMIFFAAKIFKIGILSYGKRPSIKELVRWISEKN